MPRGDIFLGTKVSHEYLRAADFARSVDDSLANLKVDYVDLLMVHWPNRRSRSTKPCRALAKAKRDGLARHVGIANPNITLLDQAIALCAEPLVELQAEDHPYLDRPRSSTPRQRDMVFVAYCPLGRGRLFSDPVLAEIAKGAAARSPRSRCAGSMQQRHRLRSRARRTPSGIAENLKVFGFTLSDDEMRASARSNARTAVSPTRRDRQAEWD